MAYTVAEITASIENSFVANVAFPKGARFWEFYDPENKNWEKIFRNETWREALSSFEPMDTSELLGYWPMLSLMTLRAFAFFLPSFLIVSLDGHKSDVFGDACANKLIPKDEEYWATLKELPTHIRGRRAP
jgi:hypothetical protein